MSALLPSFRYAFLFIWFMVGGLFNSLQGQVLVFFEPLEATPTICQPLRQTFRIVHSGSEPVGSIAVTVQLPCGMTYLPGSISGLTEVDLSLPHRPVFQVNGMTPGQEITSAYDLIVGCPSLTCLDQGEFFTTEITLDHNLGSDTYLSDPFNVQTPQLVITAVNDLVMTGSKGQVLERKITIRNTRFGRLSQFEFINSYDNGVSITTTSGQNNGSTPGALRHIIGSADFQQIGNKDEWLDFNEEIILTENIQVEACPFEINKVQSSINIRWGCEDTTCKTAEKQTIIFITANGFPGPIHEVVANLKSPPCKYDSHLRQRLVIRDTSLHHDMLNLKVVIECQGIFDYMLAENIEAKINGQTFQPIISEPFPTDCGELAIKTITFEIPELKSGQELVIEWDSYYCKNVICAYGLTLVEWALTYEKSCAAAKDRHFNTSNYFTEEDRVTLASAFNLLDSLEGPLTSGTTFTLRTSVWSEGLKKDGNYLQFRFTIPCGFTLTDTSFTLFGKQPEYKEILFEDSITKVRLDYLLPFPSSPVFLDLPFIFHCDSTCSELPCRDSLITTCPQTCPSGNSLVSIGGITSISTDPECLPESMENVCYDFIFETDCYTGVCYDTLPGYFDFKLSATRTSLGLPDNNNDYKPDPGGQLNINNIRLDRMIAGDTMQLRTHGNIVMDIPDSVFNRLRMRFQLSVENQFQIDVLNANLELDKMKDGTTGFINFQNEIRIWPQGSMIPILVTVPGEFDDVSRTYRIDIDLNHLKATVSGFPLDYHFQDQDSIEIISLFYLAYNPISYPPFQNHSITVEFKGQSFLFNGPQVPAGNRSNCICESALIEVGNVNHTFGRDSRVFPLCQETINDYGIFLILGCLPDFFPFEYRSTIDRIEDIFIPAQNYIITEARISTVRINGTTINLNFPVTVPPLKNGGYSFDIDSLIREHYEENTVIFMRFDLESTVCDRSDSPNFTLQTTANIWPYYLRRQKENLVLETNLLLHWSFTRMEADIALCDQTFYDDQVSWLMRITNCGLPTTGFSDIPNLFLQMEFDHASVINVNVKNANSGQEYSDQGGWFDLGSLAVCDTLWLEVIGSNRSCQQENAHFKIGWGCAPPNHVLDPCRTDELRCTYYLPPGLLELEADADTLASNLCTPMPLSHSLFLNAELGAAFALETKVTLPSGLLFQQGSAEIRWPQNSGGWVSIPDPVILPDGRLHWALFPWLPSPGFGLPGVLFTPENGIELQFQTITDCDFVSGSRLIYTAQGKQVCDRPTNTLTRVSGPYTISGLQAPHDIPISASVDDQFICDNQLTISVQLQSGAVLTSDEKLVLELPIGLTYLPGSALTNFGQQEPIINGNRLTWQLQSGLPLSTLTLVLLLGPEAGCDPLVLPIYSSIEAVALCEATGETCPIGVMTGSRYLPLFIEKPAYVLEDMQAVFNVGSQIVQATLLQTSGNQDGMGVADLYLDLDGDGQLSPGDQLLQSQAFQFTQPGSITLIFKDLGIEPHQWCLLMLVIEPGPTCACTQALTLINKPISFPAYELHSLCWNDSLTIGTALIPLVDYQWKGANLSCLDCPMTTFHETNTSTSPLFRTLWLTESLPNGCLIEREYLLTIQPRPQLLTNEQTICQGDTILLLATEGASFVWSGEGILPGAGQWMEAVPFSSGWYTVEIVDTEGCIGRDSALVNVISFPINPAGPDTSFCLGAEASLQALAIPGYTYHWTNAGNRLNDPYRPDPTILVQEPYTFILEVSNELCRTIDSVTIQFNNDFEIMGLPDTFRACKGDTAHFILPEGIIYTWQPNYTWLCQNPACSEVLIPIDTLITFMISAVDSHGCVANHTLVILPENEVAINVFPEFLCEGGAVVLFGDSIFMPGLYCDTIIFSSGCMDITCYDVQVLPPEITETEDTLCAGGFLVYGGDTLTIAGVYCDTLTLQDGCREIHCLTLTISPIDLVETVDSFCAGGHYIFQGDTLFAAGMYCDTLPDASGCLVAYCLNLSELPPVESLISNSLCPGETLIFFGDTLDQAGFYCATLTTSEGCDSLICLELTLDTLPWIVLSPKDTVLCPGDSLLVNPTIFPGNASFTWNDGFPTLQRTLRLPGTYLLTIIDTCGQLAEASITVSFFDPVSVFIGVDTTLCFGDELVVNPVVSGGITDWQWLDGHSEWMRTLTESGLYIFSVTDSCGTEVRDSLTLTLTACEPCDIDLPNVFTPNGDGTNDIFRVVTDCPLDGSKMLIFNRWGQVVYEGHTKVPGWNGVYKGTPQPMEVYAYVIYLTDPIEGEKTLRGDVTLLR